MKDDRLLRMVLVSHLSGQTKKRVVSERRPGRREGIIRKNLKETGTSWQEVKSESLNRSRVEKERMYF